MSRRRSKTLSIDLAYKTVQNFGICLLEADHREIVGCQFLQPSHLGLVDPPMPVLIGQALDDFCRHEGINTLILDGPQGWKDPASALVHCRACERILNAPAKTGIVGQVKPAAYTAFVEFSISLFTELIKGGGTLAFDSNIKVVPDQLLVLESLPLAAWRKLRIPPLPSKSKATHADVHQKLQALAEKFRLSVPPTCSHDELQSLVAGLAGPAIARSSGYVAEGTAPFQRDGVWLEGFIVNPNLS